MKTLQGQTNALTNKFQGRKKKWRDNLQIKGELKNIKKSIITYGPHLDLDLNKLKHF